jgi:hypothetical protein
MGNSALRIAKSLLAVGLAAIFFLALPAGESFGQPSAPPTHAAPAPSPTAISAAEVIAKSAEVSTLLNTLSAEFAATPEIDKIQQSVPEITRQIDLDFTNTSVTLGEQPPLTTIQAELARWQHRRQQVNAWLTQLTQLAVQLRAAYDTLSRTAETWGQTREAVRAEQAPPAILQQVAATLTAIEAAQARLKLQEDSVLELQGKLAAELNRCNDALDQISRAQKSTVAGMLGRENLPIWSHELWSKGGAVLPQRLTGIGRGFRASIREFLVDPSRGLPVFAALFLSLALMTVAARRRKRHWAASGIGVSAAVNVFEQPFSAALMVVLWVASSPVSTAPDRFKDLLFALAFVPVIRLVRRMIDPRMLSMLFAVVMLYMADLLRKTLGGVPLVEQMLLLFESTIAVAALAWLLHQDRLRHIPGQVAPILRSRFSLAVLKLLVVTLAAGGLTAVLGFTRLARMVTPAVLNGAALVLILIAAVQMARGALAIALRGWPMDRLQMVRKHCDLLEHWA